MNYDPIHDTYTPARESNPESAKVINSSQQSSHEISQARVSPMIPHNEGPAISTGLNQAALAASSMPSDRTQSNLHHLLDNSAQETISDSSASKFHQNGAFNNPTTSHLQDVNVGEAQSNLGSHGHQNGDLSSLNTHVWSPSDENPSISHLDITPNSKSETTQIVPSATPVQDFKFSINNLLASEKATDKSRDNVVDEVTPSLETKASSSTTDYDVHELSNSVDDIGELENSKSPFADQKLPMGVLPPNFRSFSEGFKHLKKPDGEPFWRRDIQYDFLEELFGDKNRVFTNVFPHSDLENVFNGPKLSFAELYIRTLAESSKSSKILSERLLRDSKVGIAVSKVCLLVNAGRMNTTVNFVPEMRSALRTYHSIPSLQAGPKFSTKPLQDTPRLKTMLKAVCDGQDRLTTLLDIIKQPAEVKPNTNVIKLIFLMSTFFQNVPYHYHDSSNEDDSTDLAKFPKASSGPPNRFMEFFLNRDMHPGSRAKRFLWLMYTYLETSFKEEELEQNPFNPKQIPSVEYLSSQEIDLFDKDTDYEIEYATRMYHVRIESLNEEIEMKSPKTAMKSEKDRKGTKNSIAGDRDRLEHGSMDGGSADNSIMAEDSLLKEKDDERGYERVEENEEVKKFEDAKIVKNKRSLEDSKDNIPRNDYAEDFEESKEKECSKGDACADDMADSGHDEDCVNGGDGQGDVEPFDDSSKSILNSDRSKRKKINPLVGSSVDDQKRSDFEAKWKNPKFPIKNIKELRNKYSLYTRKIPVKSLGKESVLSISQKKAVAQKSKGIIAHMAQAVPYYEAKRKEMSQWMYRYFQYKKSTGNGLLGIEWEDIRHDLINGIEAYLYQQLGKRFITHNYEEQLDEERHENGDPELLKRASFITGSKHLPGDSAPIDVGDLENFGSGFSSTHDFDNANERTTYEYMLLQAVEDLLPKLLLTRIARVESVRFNLEAKNLSFSKST